MATPTALPATFVASTVLPASDLNLLRGAFRVLQVIQGTTSTPTPNITATMADTSLTATITPQYSTSKVLVLTSQSIYNDPGAVDPFYQLLRGTTVIQAQQSMVYNPANLIVGNASFIYLDSPATTAATTYKTQIRRGTVVGTVTTQVNSIPATITLIEISA